MNDFYKFSIFSVAGRNAAHMNEMEYLRNIINMDEKFKKEIEKRKEITR